MKRLVLIVMAVMVFAGMSVAQDIWWVGYYTNSDGYHAAAVYKNNAMLQYIGTSTNDHESTAVDVYNGDYYWVDNCINADGTFAYGDIMKNNNTRYLSTSGGSHLYDIYRFPSGGRTMVSVGCKNVNGVKTAVYYSEDYNTPYQLGNGYYESVAFGATGYDGYLFSCGYQYTSSSAYNGVIWRSTDVFKVFGSDTKLYDIAYYNGYLYTVGSELENGTCKLKVWQVSVAGGSISTVYTLSSSMSSSFVDNRFSIYIESGDIYVNGMDVSTEKIWKNGEVLYTDGYFLTSVVANTNGVYYSGCQNSSSNGAIWKDGTYLLGSSYTSVCDRVLNLFIADPECTDSEVRSLPFDDGFENEETSWACWTTVDVDNNNGAAATYWERIGERAYANPHTGHHCVRHLDNGSNDQEGWLISPKLFLQPGSDYTMLSFSTYEQYPSYYGYEGVWISTSGTSTSSFTEIWTQTDPDNEWNTVEIDLTEYQGEAVYIAFKYTGNNAHAWYIDNVSVYDFFQPCPWTNVPFVDSFDDEINWCWYIFDGDMSGDNRCWQYSSSEQSAYHPWGQQNTPQEGWLISRGIQLPAGQNYLLTFNERNFSSGTNMKNSVLVAVDVEEDEMPEIGDFTEVWSESSGFPSSWTQRSIDLTAYAGHTVNIAFKYEGTWAHNWYIDDINLDNNTPEYTITVVANNAAWGSVTGGNTYQQGANVTITATPNTGYEFKQWTKDGVNISTNPTYSFIATEDATYTAIFGEPEVVYYTINAVADPAEGGSVAGGNTYPAGATAYLTATANVGWQFSNWNDDNTDNPRQIIVNANASYTAYFTQLSYTITVEASPAEGGTVSGGGSFHYGDMATLSATPNAGYVFHSWSDGETNSTRMVSVTGHATYTALFAEEGVTTYNITVTPNDPALGSTTGTGTYPEGSVISISAEPQANVHFVNWGDGNTDNPRQITVTQDATYVAIFEADRMYTINVESDNPTMGTATGGGTFPEGTVITISATANEGYYFVGWNDGNAENPRYITVTQDATYRALFSQNAVVTYTVTVMCNSSEGTVSGSGTYAEGSVITIAATPNSGFEFDKWNDENTQNPRQVTVNDNLIFVAFFRGTGVDENGTTTVTIYPNPANESICIAGIESNSEVRIFNSLGMLVKVVNVSADQEIGISELAAGLYVARCGNSTMRFVKQ